ncbi:MAG: hypothetical protein IJO21_02580 [Oscillospiraceae bacterium]|nr:hypothetical protein [Oscillospiraceae bacterium]
MNTRNISRILLSFLGILALILDGRTALLGAAEGIRLCIRTVIPSLFPFLFFCGILTNTLWGTTSPLLRPAARLLGVPKGGESLMIAGFLGGYPAGAQAIGDACRTGRLDPGDGARLLTCCCNAGPGFLFGMIAPQFSSGTTVFHLWMLQILSACMTGVLFCRDGSASCSLSSNTASISRILRDSVLTMGLICGWILLFRVLLSFLERWLLWFFSPELQVAVTGLLELSNGCCGLSAIRDESLRFLVCAGMLSFGGICVAMQTASVIGSLPLSAYLLGKVVQTLLSLVLAVLFLRLGSIFYPISVLLLLLLSKIRKKLWISRSSRCIMPVSPPGGKRHAVS